MSISPAFYKQRLGKAYMHVNFKSAQWLMTWLPFCSFGISACNSCKTDLFKFIFSVTHAHLGSMQIITVIKMLVKSTPWYPKVYRRWENLLTSNDLDQVPKPYLIKVTKYLQSLIRRKICVLLMKFNSLLAGKHVLYFWHELRTENNGTSISIKYQMPATYV